jgi:phosphatidylserine/phosphatidylglycerophosphate/cardiolipin synthase-like enzyme
MSQNIISNLADQTRKIIIVGDPGAGISRSLISLLEEAERGIVIVTPDGITSDGGFIDLKAAPRVGVTDYTKILITPIPEFDPEIIIEEKIITNPYNRQGNKIFYNKKR